MVIDTFNVSIGYKFGLLKRVPEVLEPKPE
jgi:hypothetical protein